MTQAKIFGQGAGFVSGGVNLGPIARIKRVIAFRRILKLLVVRDLKVKYGGSILGWLWTVLDPLAMSLVYWFVFTQFFERKIGEDPYIIFLIMGQLLWGWFNGGVQGTMRALRSESQMVRSSNVPRELWIVRVVCTQGVEYLLSLPVVALFALAYLKSPTWHIALLPLAWVLMFLLVTGIGLILSPLNVLVRDIEKVVPIVLRAMFYISPVLYSIATITVEHPALEFVYAYNPVVGPLSLARATFFPQEFRGYFIWHSVVLCVAIFVIGLFTFSRLERSVLKEI